MTSAVIKFIFGAVAFVATSSLSGCKPDTLFTALPPSHTNVEFVNQLNETEEININEYLYAHNGGGVAIGDINNDGLPDIYLSANQLSKKLYLNKGGMKFEDITESAGVGGYASQHCWTTGVTMVDINDDGLLDIYVSQFSGYKLFTGKNQLYINNGDLTFTDKALEYNLDFETYSQQAAFFDYDLDGDLDMYHLNQSVKNPDVYGKSELRLKRDSLGGDRLLRNDNGKFFDVSESAGIFGSSIGYGLAVAVGDIDRNGCPDIFVSNDFHENDYVYYNNCDGTFREDIRGTLGHTSTFSMGSDLADVNNDGLLDLITVDMKPEDEMLRKSNAGTDATDIFNFKLSYGYFYQYPRNMLQINNGNLFGDNVQFSEVAQLSGMDATDWSWSALMADLDNDGWKDIYITNGILRRPIDLDYVNFTYNETRSQNMSSLQKAYLMPTGVAKNYAYRNKKNLQFENVSNEWGLDLLGCSNGTSYADLDNDGDLDLVVNNLNAPASIYRNNADVLYHNNFIKIKLEGPAGNVLAVGATVEVELDSTKFTQTLNPTRGWLSSVGYALNFGLGHAEHVKSVKVTWPDGNLSVLTEPAVNNDYTISYHNSKAPDNDAPLAKKSWLQNFTARSGISFVHSENGFNDFGGEPLLPHALSTIGPPLAAGDLNGDGLDDFFIGGSYGQSGAIFLQRNDDSVFFEKQALPVSDDAENTDAVFFDCDHDGDLDLYVVNGGSENHYPVKSTDKLFLNDGKANFKIASGLVPEIEKNGSCVVAEDFNNDGFVDIFLGSLSVVGKYGLSPRSYIVWGGRDGKFTVDSLRFSSALQTLGMVTDAAWIPDTKELVVVGTWMPITFLKFESNGIRRREIANTAGWWNTVHVADVDNDNDLDLLIGNLGLNSTLKTSVDEPVNLYINDFDSNLMTESFLTYRRQGREYLFSSLDEVKKQMPSIRRKFINYATYAKSSFGEIIDAEQIRASVRKHVDLFESVIVYNTGNSTWLMKSLPVEIQISPIYAFMVVDVNGDRKNDILCAGNFNGSTPSIGRLDASYGHLLLGDNKGNFDYIQPRLTGFSIFGEVRSLKTLNSVHAKILVASRNNAAPRVWTFGNTGTVLNNLATLNNQSQQPNKKK